MARTWQARGMPTALEPDLAAHARRMRSAVADASADDADIVGALAGLVAHRDYPCLGARSVFRRDAVEVAVLPGMDDDALAGLAERLRTFGAQHDGSEELASFIVVFRGPAPSTEEDFEAALWRVLQHLHDRDDRPWADDVASDPRDPRFAFSFAGTPFFIVGLHPAASRIARRAPLPTIVFNLHRQFERLRADGTFARMRTAIRRRDERVQGSVNPMVDDYGSTSAARQYSGRAVPPEWRAPFTARGTDR